VVVLGPDGSPAGAVTFDRISDLLADD
jgi:hypothetical protein